MENQEVDTLETTNQEIETPAVEQPDTDDTGDKTQPAIDFIKKTFPTDSEEPETENTEDTPEVVSEDESAEEEPVDTDTEGEEESDEPDENEPDTEVTEPVKDTVIELNADGNVEAIDVSTEEGKAKAKKYMEAGRYVERVRHEQKEKETVLNQMSQTLAFQRMYLESQGKLGGDEFLEKPFEYFVGKGEDDNEDLKLWNDHKKTVGQKLSQLGQYAANQGKTFEQFGKLTEQFGKNHPEITDVNKWVEENVLPYHDPIWTFGDKQFPEDTLENIYFGKNKDKIIKDAVDKAVKEYVKKPTVKKTTPSQIKTKTSSTPAEEIMKKFTKSVFNPEGRKLAG